VLKPYEEYKETSILWNQCVPKAWLVQRGKSIFQNKKELNIHNQCNNILSLTLKGVVNNSIDNPIGLVPKDYSTYQIFEKDDLVFKLIDLENFQTSRVGLVYERGIMSPAYICLALRKKNDFNIKYFFYQYYDLYLRRIFNQIGAGVRSTLSAKELLNIDILIPSREEQDQIVRFLDWKLAKINKLIRAKKKQIALLNEQKQVIINNAVTKGLDPNVPMKDSGIEWIGTIPEHWKVLYLSQTATEQSISNKDIRNQNLLSLSYGKIINKDINTTNGLLPASFDTYQIVHNGNIILRLTDLQNDHKSLRVGLVTQTGIITSAYTCLLPRRNVVPEFLYLLLHSYDVCKVFYGMGGGVRQSIGFDDIRRLLIPVPPLGEQKQIADFCYIKSDFIERLVVSIEKEILLLTEYRTRLISDVVTGKLDVRGIVVPDYESDEEVTDNEMREDEETDDVEEME